MKKTMLLATAFVASLGLAAQNIHTFEDEGMKAVIDRSNGALVSLENKHTGWSVIPEETGRSFEMRIRDFRGNILNTNGLRQSPPECTFAGDSLVLVWDGIRTTQGGKPVDIRFVGCVKFTPKDGLIFSGRLENHSDMTVETLVWPCIGGLSVPDVNDKLKYTSVTYSRLAETEIYPSTGFGGSGSNLPEQAFVLLGNDRQGVYFSNRDHKMTEYIRFSCSPVPSRKYLENLGRADAKTTESLRDSGLKYAVRTERRLYVHPGEKMPLVPFVVRTYEGDWHRGADIYKAWKATWYVAPQWPEWVQKVNAWQQLQINSSESRINFTVKDLVNYARECRKYGVDAIQLTGWNRGGQDRGVPGCEIDPRLGTMEELKQAIAECKKLGVRILLFTKFTWADFQSPDYDDYKNSVVINDQGKVAVHGGCSYNTYTQLTVMNNRRFGILCFQDDKCRERLCEEFKKCLDLGAPGMVYDENQHHAGAFLCFSPNHGHHVPGFVYGGADKLGRDFQEMTRKYNPDFLMVGEAPYDIQSQYYATYTRGMPDLKPAIRYITPDLPMSHAVIDHYDLNRVNLCLRCRYIVSYEPRNFKGHLGEFPRVMAYGKKMDDLRRRYASYLWEAEFRDTQGASVSGENLQYSVFVRKDGKRAVVVANLDTAKSCVARVALDTPATGALLTASPLAPESVPFDGTVEVGPQGAVVIMEQ